MGLKVLTGKRVSAPLYPFEAPGISLYMADVAREMNRMYAIALGYGVPSNQRLQKIRELRERDFAQLRAEQDEEPRAIKRSTPWIPPRIRRF